MAGKGLNALELKERSRQISTALATCLPECFSQAADILVASLGPGTKDSAPTQETGSPGLSGWAIMPMTHYVGVHGISEPDVALPALREMTKRFTAEFDIRCFILEHEAHTLTVLREWITDPDPHVRRLVSEGLRPRLPWAMQLPKYVQDPSPILPFLDALKDDPSEYVRRSVANNLNDIAKDHPNLVGDIASNWLVSASPEREKLIKHACRTLLKQGHSHTLKAFGYHHPKLHPVDLNIHTPTVPLGGYLDFSIELQSNAKTTQTLMIDFIIHHQKANGKTSPKVFKWKTCTLAPNTSLSASKKHPLKKITTRVYYPGCHYLELLVNGSIVAKATFDLKIKN